MKLYRKKMNIKKTLQNAKFLSKYIFFVDLIWWGWCVCFPFFFLFLILMLLK